MPSKNSIWFFLGNKLRFILPFRLYGIMNPGVVIANPNTLITIEAFPRSGNTYLCALLSQRLDEKRIAHHLHHIAHLARSLSCGIPTVFITRNPKQSIPSYIIRENIPVIDALIQFEDLYKYVVKNQHQLLVLDFKHLVQRNDNLYRLLNDVLGSQYKWEDIEEQSIAQKVEAMDKRDSGGTINEKRVGRPSNSRNSEKENLQRVIEEHYPARFERCMKLYMDVAGGITTPQIGTNT